MRPELAGDLRLIDQETGEARALWVDADTLRRYRERLQQFLDGIEAFCRTQEITYHRVMTDVAPEEVVMGPFRGRLLA
jgi:hypothetical protein